MSEYEKLVESVAGVLANVLECLPAPDPWGPRHIADKADKSTFREEHLGYARSAIALIAERTKEATSEMARAAQRDRAYLLDDTEEMWIDAFGHMHAASALYPPVLPTQAQQMESGE